MHKPNGPFDSIETAQEYLRLLLEEIERTRATVETDIRATHGEGQNARAIELVTYSLLKLSNHMKASLKILNDLVRLRALLHCTASCAKSIPEARDESSAEDASAIPIEVC